MIQGPALMRHLKTDAYLFCILSENFLIGDNDKTGGIGTGMIHTLLQHLKPVELPGVLSRNRCLRLISVIRNLFGCEGIILHTDLLPFMIFQILSTLH